MSWQLTAPDESGNRIWLQYDAAGNRMTGPDSYSFNAPDNPPFEAFQGYSGQTRQVDLGGGRTASYGLNPATGQWEQLYGTTDGKAGFASQFNDGNYGSAAGNGALQFQSHPSDWSDKVGGFLDQYMPAIVGGALFAPALLAGGAAGATGGTGALAGDAAGDAAFTGGLSGANFAGGGGALTAGGTGALAGGATGGGLSGTALTDSILSETGAGTLGGGTAGTIGAGAAATGAAGAGAAGAAGGAGTGAAGTAGAAGTGDLTGTALSDSILSETGSGALGNAGYGAFGATAAGGAAAAAAAAAKASSIKAIMDGTATAADYLKVLGVGGAALADLTKNNATTTSTQYPAWYTAGAQDAVGKAMAIPGYTPYTPNTARFMNPYVKGALDPAADAINLNFDKLQNDNDAKAAARGAFGGSRATLAGQAVDTARGRSLTDLYGKGYADAYNSAQSLDVQDQNASRNWPVTQVGALATALRGTGDAGQVKTTTPPAPSIIGGVTGALGALDTAQKAGIF